MSFLCVTRSRDLISRAHCGPSFKRLRWLPRGDAHSGQTKSVEIVERKMMVCLARNLSQCSRLLSSQAIRSGCDFIPSIHLSYATTADLFGSMTNKPRFTMPISALNNKTGHRGLHRSSEDLNGRGTKTNRANGTHPAQNQQQKQAPYDLRRNPDFRTMASLQKLAIEPTREHIENIRKNLRHTNAKDNSDQQVTLEKDHNSGIGYMCIKSAAKNGISAKMMCDFLDTIDELHAWPEGKGVLIYGHNGFFCSGRCPARAEAMFAFDQVGISRSN